MSFTTELKAYSRKPVTLVKIKLDYCTLTYGVLPCTAIPGTKCYNTFTTCKATSAYNKTTKEYKFCSNTVVKIPDGYRPYLKSVSYNPTQINEEKTIPQRNTYIFCDERDYDAGIDPYLTDRGYTSIFDCPGTFWKKLLARNKNFKKRILEEYQGFEGLDEADFQLVYVGRIENILDNNGTVEIKTVDLLKALDEIKYPIKTTGYLTQALGAIFKASTNQDMYNLNAIQNDYCLRTDFITKYTLSVSYLGTGGTLPAGEYYYTVYGYDQYNRCAVKFASVHMTVVEGSTNKITLSWPTVAGITKYRIYHGSEEKQQMSSVEVATNSFIHDAATDFSFGPLQPTEAQRYCRLEGTNPGNPADWTTFYGVFTLTMNSTSDLDIAGIVRIGNEYIQYSAKTDAQLTITGRALYSSEASSHIAGSAVYRIFYAESLNPYRHLQSLLDLCGITSEYRSDTWATLQAAYAGIPMSLRPMLKDTTMAKIIYDLANVIDISIWENEYGKIDVRENMDLTINFSIDETKNIIYRSQTVDNGQADRISRIDLYWSRQDETKDLTDKENYLRINGNWNLTAESDNDLGEPKLKEMFTGWINTNLALRTEILTYVNTLLANKLKRLKDPHPVLKVELELKDSDILVGQVGNVSTSAILNADGTAYSLKKFQVIEKEKISNNKFRLLLKEKEYPVAVHVETLDEIEPIYSSKPAQENVGDNPSDIYLRPFTITAADIALLEKDLGNIAGNYLLKKVILIVSQAFPSNNKISLSDDDGELVNDHTFDLVNFINQPQEIPIYKTYSGKQSLSAALDGTSSGGSATLILEIAGLTQ